MIVKQLLDANSPAWKLEKGAVTDRDARFDENSGNFINELGFKIILGLIWFILA